MANDYDYSDDHVQLSDSDRGANTAEGIGLDLTITPQENWPGTSADPNRLRHNTDQMREIADSLDSYIRNNLEGDTSGMPGSLVSLATVTYGPDHWEAAARLKRVSGDVTRLVAEYSAALVENLRNAANAIRAAANTYDGGESANVSTVANTQNSLDANRQTTNF